MGVVWEGVVGALCADCNVVAVKKDKPQIPLLISRLTTLSERINAGKVWEDLVGIHWSWTHTVVRVYFVRMVQ